MPPKKDKNQHIQVVLRCRPLSSKEKARGSWSIVDTNPEGREVSVRERPNPTAPIKTFHFDKVYGPSAQQIEVYKGVIVPMLDEVLQGYNCTVFAYGQTGTGKTFTMEGERSDGDQYTWENDPKTGIIPRTMQQLFSRLQRQSLEFTVKVSFLEIYNEELIDLLGAESVENPRLKIYEDVARKGSCVIQGLEEVTVHSKNEVYSLLETGAARRQTAATQMNAHSSRSHTLFMVTVHMKENTIEGEELLKIGKFNLVDLAGSENIGRSGAVEKRAREAGQINQSLLTLGRVITALVEHAPHIPYRESKLTRLLQDSLGGRTKTSIIATVSPASYCHDETLSTLDYAHRAKNITNRPEVNQKLTKKELLKEYTEEIERMRRDLQASRDKNGVYLAQENYDAMNTKIQQQVDTIKEQYDRIDALEEQKIKLEELFNQQKEELDNTKKDLRQTSHEREEQKHLVSRHMMTEAKLSAQANQLVNTADLATADVHGLQAKVDRTKDTETHNLSVQEKFSKRIRNEIKETDESTKDFSDSQTSFNASISKNLSNMVQKQRSGVEDMCKKLEAIKSLVCNDLTAFKDTRKTQNASKIEWLEHIREQAKDHQEEDGKKLKFLQQKLVADQLGEVQDLLRKQENLLKDHANLVQNILSEQAQQVNEFLLDHEQKLREHKTLLEEHHKFVIASHEERCEMMKKNTLERKDLAKSLKEEMEAVMKKSMDKFLSDLINDDSERLEKMLEENKETGVTMKEHTSKALENKSDESDHCRAAREKFSEKSKEDKVEIDGDMAKSRDVNAALVKKTELLNAGVSEHVETHMCHLSSRLDKHLTQLSVHKELLDTELSDTIHSYEELEKRHNRDVKCMKEMNQCALDDLDSTVTKQQELLAENQSQTKEWYTALNHAFQDQSDLVQTFIDEELKTTKVTGNTPQRRDFHYPRILSRTGDHNLILEEFNCKLHMDDAVSTQVPNTSFESVSSEKIVTKTELPPNLSTDKSQNLEDGDEVLSDSNLSVDSAVGSASIASQDSRCDTKENQMRPPKTNITRRKKLPASNKNTLSANSTPTKRDRTPNKAAGVKTPNSQKAGSKLPLRSSANRA